MNMPPVELPPYALRLDISVHSNDPPSPVLRMPFSEDVTGRPDFLHGGAIAGLLEMAAIAALQSALAQSGQSLTIKPINIQANYMRGGRAQDSFAQGIVTRLGRTVANVEAKAWQVSPDKPITDIKMNFLLKPKEH